MVDLASWLPRFLHLYAGVMWVGGIFLWGMLVLPSVRKRLPPNVTGPFTATVLPRYARYVNLAGVLTVLTGLWTMGAIVGFENISGAFQEPGWGTSLGAAFFVSLLMLAVGFAVVVPASRKLVALAGRAGEAPEAAGLQKRLFMATMVNMLLGTVALGLMAWAVSSRVG